MSSPKSPMSAFSRLGLNRPKPLRILVLGQNGVGKSALVVRYITRRFIGDYDPLLQRVYAHTSALEGEKTYLEILDSACQSKELDTVRLEADIRWADAFLLLYSVTDKCSFDDCNRLKFLINYNKRKRRMTSVTPKDLWCEVPVILVGNKKDVENDRMVHTLEGLKRSQDIDCVSFHEISVRESIDEVMSVFNDLISRWREACKVSKSRRASSECSNASTVVGLDSARDSLSPSIPVSEYSFRNGFSTDCIESVRSRIRSSNEVTFNADTLEDSLIPFRERASTDGWLHKNRVQKLRLNRGYKDSQPLGRRVSIAMRGETTGF